MRAFRPLGPILVLAALALAACDTAEERAEGHYQRGMALLAEGDADRAMVEFRNVFRLNGNHGAARAQYAALLRERGETREALGQYLRLVEQDPDDAAGHRGAAELALQIQDFDTAALHAARAFALDPADPAIRALKATVDYRAGADRAAAVAMAHGVLAEAPDNVAAHMVVIADRLAAGAPAEALAQADAALARAPRDEGLHLVRLATLESLGDVAGIGAELERMAGLFPGNDGVHEALVQWHLNAGDPAAAEAVLRGLAAQHPEEPARALAVVRFLLDTQGPEAARAELDARVAAAADPRPFRQARAGLDFAQGRAAEAIAAMRGLLEGAEPSDATRDLQVGLAGMLQATGAAEESAALVAAVLAGDPAHVAALKLSARAAIEADRPEDAIRDARAALAEAPRDPEIATIMALAHEREGSRELAGERLALAVELAGGAPAESLRYAGFLMQDGRAGPAEDVVADALRRAPGDGELLETLGRIRLARRDWAGAAEAAAELRAQGGPAAEAAAAGLETASLQGQGRGAEAIARLEGLAGGSAAAMAELVRSHVAAGDMAAAEAYVDSVLAADLENLPGRFLQAGVLALRGEAAAAEALYRGVIADAPGLSEAHRALAALLAGQGRTTEAMAALDAGIAAAPDAADLLFAKAGLLEAAGDTKGAVALYEALYARDGGDEVVANNLASLLTGQGAEPAELERAFAIARRLRDSEVPQFRDTYGWILYLRGDAQGALDHLAPAAEALPGNALVQFHRAEAELALGRREAARAAYLGALAAAEAGSPLPQAAAARARLDAIGAAPAAEPGDPGGALSPG